MFRSFWKPAPKIDPAQIWIFMGPNISLWWIKIKSLTTGARVRTGELHQSLGFMTEWVQWNAGCGFEASRLKHLVFKSKNKNLTTVVAALQKIFRYRLVLHTGLKKCHITGYRCRGCVYWSFPASKKMQLNDDAATVNEAKWTELLPCVLPIQVRFHSNWKDSWKPKMKQLSRYSKSDLQQEI